MAIEECLKHIAARRADRARRAARREALSLRDSEPAQPSSISRPPQARLSWSVRPASKLTTSHSAEYTSTVSDSNLPASDGRPALSVNSLSARASVIDELDQAQAQPGTIVRVGTVDVSPFAVASAEEGALVEWEVAFD